MINFQFKFVGYWFMLTVIDLLLGEENVMIRTELVVKKFDRIVLGCQLTLNCFLH